MAAATAAVPAAALTTLGLKVDLQANPPVAAFGWTDLALFVILMVTLAGAFAVASWALAPLRVRGARAVVSRRWWLAATAMMLVLWLPYYLTYFPGLISPDSVNSLAQIQGWIPFSNHHPIAFTLLVGAIVGPVVSLGGSMQAAVAVYSALQLVLTAVTLVAVLAWIQRRTRVFWLPLALGLVFALNPVIPTLGVTMWKDIPFSLVFVWFCLLLFEAVESNGAVFRSTGWTALFVAVALGLGMLRNNAIYILFMTFVVLIVVFRGHWRRVVPVALVVILGLPLLQGPLYRAAGFEPSNAAEALGVPLQQIGYVLRYVDPEPATAARIDRVLEVEIYRGVYRPQYSNPVKFNKEFDDSYLNENTGEFLRLWADMFLQNPVSYLKGYAALTHGYYTLGETDYVYPRSMPDATLTERLGLRADPLFGPGATRDGRLAAVTHGLADIAVAMGILLVVAVVLMKRHRWGHLLWLLPSFGLWGTLMVAAPISGEFRYLYPAYLFAPIAVALLLVPDSEST